MKAWKDQNIQFHSLQSGNVNTALATDLYEVNFVAANETKLSHFLNKITNVKQKNPQYRQKKLYIGWIETYRTVLEEMI